MSRVEGKMSRVEGKCRGFKNVGIFLSFKKKKKQTKQNKNTERKKIKTHVVSGPELEPPSFWSTVRAPYHCATKPTLEIYVKISLLTQVNTALFPPKRFHPQTNSTWLGSRHHPSSIVVFLQHRFFWSQTTLVIAADANHDFLEKNFFSSSQRACTRPFFIATIYWQEEIE